MTATQNGHAAVDEDRPRLQAVPSTVDGRPAGYGDGR